MKRLFCLLICIVLFTGCAKGDGELDQALQFRQRLISGNGCRFSCEICADYGDVIYRFSMDCQADKQGNLSFCVTAPDSISGITGAVTQQGGHLTFDGTALAFAPIADGQLTPVTAPWVFLKTLMSGYIGSAAKVENGIYLQIDDSYLDNALHTDIWLSDDLQPIGCEILWEGRRVLSITVKDFSIL